MVPAWADKYIGIPWVSHGRGPEGYDCWGLIRFIAKDQFGWDWPSYDDTYTLGSQADDVSVYKVNEGLIKDWHKIHDDDQSAFKYIDRTIQGDIIWLKHKSHVVHMGMMLDTRKFIHVSATTDSIISRADHFIWKNKILGYYRWKH